VDSRRDDAAQPPMPLNLRDTIRAAREADRTGAVRSLVSTDLNVNVVRLAQGESIERHVNREVDVLIIVLEGAGTLIIADQTHELQAGIAMMIPKESWRAIHAASDSDLAYVTCHRRRPGLFPTRPSQS